MIIHFIFYFFSSQFLALLKVLKVRFYFIFSVRIGSSLSLVITRAKSLKIARFAFEIAKHDERKKVTAVHKANIM
jgi:isocitrate dehydrogenase